MDVEATFEEVLPYLDRKLDCDHTIREELKGHCSGSRDEDVVAKATEVEEGLQFPFDRLAEVCANLEKAQRNRDWFEASRVLQGACNGMEQLVRIYYHAHLRMLDDRELCVEVGRKFALEVLDMPEILVKLYKEPVLLACARTAFQTWLQLQQPQDTHEGLGGYL